MAELSYPWQGLAAPIALALVALALGLWLGRVLARRRSHRRMKRLRRLGKRGEQSAERLLRKAGYTVVQWQASVQTMLLCDGEPVSVRVTADALLKRKGKRFVAEVKGGRQAAKLTNRATRRQLLEYAVAFDCAGVVLVDAFNGAVHIVEFPALRR